jgi:putative heme-binding domain-containing protein
MHFSQRFRLALAAAVAALVLAAQPLAAQTTAQDHPGQYSASDIETGSRLYAGQCALCHGTNGDTVAGVDLRRGQFRRAVSDEDIARVISTGVPAAGMPGFKFQPTEIDGLVAFIRAGFDVSGTAVKVGHAGRGQAVYEGKGQCGTCHRVKGVGPRTAPDLTDIGAIRTPSALQRSLTDPTTAMLPINRPVKIVTKDGRTIRGRRLNEDTFTVQLIDDKEQLLSLAKADLREFEVAKTSTMPSYATRLTAEEQADLLAYLLSLKGL